MNKIKSFLKTYLIAGTIILLPIIITILQMVVFIFLLFVYYDYRKYFISYIMIKYWTAFQAIYLSILFTFIFKNFKIKWIPLAALLIGAITIALITIFNQTLHGNNSHIYWPLIGFGLYYITTTLILKNAIAKNYNR